MNKYLLDIFFENKHTYDFIHNRKLVYEYFNDEVVVFNSIFYPYIESLKEKDQLEELVEKLTNQQKEYLLEIPKTLILPKTIEIIEFSVDNENNTLEFRCFERAIKSYKHPVFFEFIALITIRNNFSIEKENHKFGYHFHLYEKTQRTATLLTFDKDESPNRKTDPTYSSFLHSLYYEPHSEGSVSKDFQDINSKNSRFKSKLYEICKNTLITNIEKIYFKKQSSTKSIKYIP